MFWLTSLTRISNWRIRNEHASNTRILPSSIRILYVVCGVGLIIGMMFWFSLQLDPPQELALIAVLVITIGTVIIAAFITATIHRLIGPPGSEAVTGLVFRESIKRYAWVAAPIASGYGITQIVRTVGDVIVRVQ